MRRALQTTAIAALALTAGAGLWSSFGSPSAPLSMMSAQAQTSAATDAAAPQSGIVIEDMTLGREDAPIVLVEYASYTCPHCANFYNNVLKKLKKDYVDTGKMRFIYRDVYFDRYGLWAAMIARCSGPDRFFAVQDRLYATQKDWISDDPATTINNLKKIGLSVGMDTQTLDSCLQDGPMAEALIARYRETVAQDDVSSTPTLIINGTKHPNLSYDDLVEVLDEQLAQDMPSGN